MVNALCCAISVPRSRSGSRPRCHGQSCRPPRAPEQSAAPRPNSPVGSRRGGQHRPTPWNRTRTCPPSTDRADLLRKSGNPTCVCETHVFTSSTLWLSGSVHGTHVSLRVGPRIRTWIARVSAARPAVGRARLVVAAAAAMRQAPKARRAAVSSGPSVTSTSLREIELPRAPEDAIVRERALPGGGCDVRESIDMQFVARHGVLGRSHSTSNLDRASQRKRIQRRLDS